MPLLCPLLAGGAGGRGTWRLPQFPSWFGRLQVGLCACWPPLLDFPLFAFPLLLAFCPLFQFAPLPRPRLPRSSLACEPWPWLGWLLLAELGCELPLLDGLAGLGGPDGRG